MDHQDVINAMALKREKKRQMKELPRAGQVALREKVRERAMLKRKKQSMLAKEAAKQKLVDDFMLFIEAIEEKDVETAQYFDEKAMMNTILTMMNSGDNGRHAVDDFMLFIEAIKENDVETDQNFDEKAIMNTILTMTNGGGGHNGDNGRYAVDDGKKEA